MTTAWTIDVEQSRIDFSLRYYTFQRVKGSFARWSGRIDLDEDDISRSSAEVEIEAASVSTGIEERDREVAKHFFAAHEFPRFVFKSRSVARAGGDGLQVVGDLQLRGVTRPVTLETARLARGTRGSDRIAFTAKTEIARKKWGVACMTQGDLSPLLIGSTVSIEIALEAVRAP
jgi:polyisoprenoid-binding protein YceI